jgi:hypothetical protein
MAAAGNTACDLRALQRIAVRNQDEPESRNGEAHPAPRPFIFSHHDRHPIAILR